MRHLVYLNWCAPFVSAIMHELLHVIGKQKIMLYPVFITNANNLHPFQYFFNVQYVTLLLFQRRRAGLEHEQKRIDRPDHITFNTSGLGSAVKAQYKVDHSLNLQETPYDFCSLMHYSSRMEKKGK